MPGCRSKDAWIWVAVVAITLASVARAQAGIENARAYASPVIKFLAGSQNTESAESASAHGAASSGSHRIFGTVVELLPVFFVGLVAPLGVQPLRPLHAANRTLPAHNSFGLFQRPPPVLFA
jgi:hypothetical protein